MGKIKLKIAILFVLLLCLGAGYLYMNGMKIEDVPTAIGESLTNNDKDYTIYEYTITKIDGDEYYGQAKNGTKIIFNGKKFEDDVADLKASVSGMSKCIRDAGGGCNAVVHRLEVVIPLGAADFITSFPADLAGFTTLCNDLDYAGCSLGAVQCGCGRTLDDFD